LEFLTARNTNVSHLTQKNYRRKFSCVYPDDIEAELNDPAIVKEKYEFVVDVPYASVPAEKVIHAIYREAAN
jgi:hypothetical protein